MELYLKIALPLFVFFYLIHEAVRGHQKHFARLGLGTFILGIVIFFASLSKEEAFDPGCLLGIALALISIFIISLMLMLRIVWWFRGVYRKMSAKTVNRIPLLNGAYPKTGFPLKPEHLRCPLAERSRSKHKQADWLRLRSANSHAVPSKTGRPKTKINLNSSTKTKNKKRIYEIENWSVTKIFRDDDELAFIQAYDDCQMLVDIDETDTFIAYYEPKHQRIAVNHPAVVIRFNHFNAEMHQYLLNMDAFTVMLTKNGNTQVNICNLNKMPLWI